MKFRLVWVAAIIAVLVGVTMMGIAWNHNPQCEIRCEGVIHLKYWFAIGLSWAFVVFSFVYLIGFVFNRLFK